MSELTPEQLEKIRTAFLRRRQRQHRPTLREVLLARAKGTYPYYPSYPFCSNWVSVNLVREVLEEVGYKDFRLFIHPKGIFIERK